jgi:hypothetical protein
MGGWRKVWGLEFFFEGYDLLLWRGRALLCFDEEDEWVVCGNVVVGIN